MTNIIGEFKKTDEKSLLLAAHFDTRPFADRDSDPNYQLKPILGANDGASGVAVLLHIAEIIAQKTPPQNVTVVFFDGEDFGKSTETMFLGSKYFSEHTDKTFFKYGILIDMIGDKELQIFKEKNSVYYAPEIVNKVFDRANDLKLPGFFNSEKYSIYDDHIFLNKAGIPCVDLIDFDFELWHTTKDDLAAVSADSLGQIGKLLLSIIYNPIE